MRGCVYWEEDKCPRAGRPAAQRQRAGGAVASPGLNTPPLLRFTTTISLCLSLTLLVFLIYFFVFEFSFPLLFFLFLGRHSLNLKKKTVSLYSLVV